MDDKRHILQRIKNSVTTTDPNATLILYGSYARGDFREDSDIDILILIDKDKITYDDLRRISSPIYDIELDIGTIISPRIYTKQSWSSHKVTPFYENVNREGIVL